MTFENGAYKMSDKLIDMAKIKQTSKVLDITIGIGEPVIAVAKRMTTGAHAFSYRHIITKSTGTCALMPRRI